MAKPLKLVKMTPEDFDYWLARNKRDYAADKMRANRLTQEEADAIAERDTKRLLPDGLESVDNYLFTAVDEEQNKVGYMWFGARGPEDNRKAYLYDIVVEDAHQGKGCGRGIMNLLEEEVRGLGISEIGLHVFGFNTTAINLYQSLGYETTDLMMAKRL